MESGLPIEPRHAIDMPLHASSSSSSSSSASCASPSSADETKYRRSYATASLENFVRSVCKLVAFITLVTMLLLVVVLTAEEMPLSHGDRVHLFAVIGHLFLIAFVAMIVFRREYKTLLAVLVAVSMFNGYVIAYVGHNISEHLSSSSSSSSSSPLLPEVMESS